MATFALYSINRLVFKTVVEVLTAQYRPIPYIKQITFSLQKVKFIWDIFLSDVVIILDS